MAHRHDRWWSEAAGEKEEEDGWVEGVECERIREKIVCTLKRNGVRHDIDMRGEKR